MQFSIPKRGHAFSPGKTCEVKPFPAPPEFTNPDRTSRACRSLASRIMHQNGVSASAAHIKHARRHAVIKKLGGNQARTAVEEGRENQSGLRFAWGLVSFRDWDGY